MEILKTVDLKKYYGSGENQVKALDGVNLSVEEGEFVSEAMHLSLKRLCLFPVFSRKAL